MAVPPFRFSVSTVEQAHQAADGSSELPAFTGKHAFQRGLVYEVAQTIGIDPDHTVRVFFFEVFTHRNQQVYTLQRFAVSAGYDRLITGELLLLKRLDHLVKIWLMLQPEIRPGAYTI